MADLDEMVRYACAAGEEYGGAVAGEGVVAGVGAFDVAGETQSVGG